MPPIPIHLVIDSRFHICFHVIVRSPAADVVFELTVEFFTAAGNYLFGCACYCDVAAGPHRNKYII